MPMRASMMKHVVGAIRVIATGIATYSEITGKFNKCIKMKILQPRQH